MNGDETQVSLEPVSGKCLRINGRHKNNITAFLQCTSPSNWNMGVMRTATHVSNLDGW